MSNRCYVAVEVSPHDIKALQECMGEDGDDCGIEKGVAHYGFSEMNYGAEEQLKELAKRKVPFIAYNSEGGDYSAGFAIYGAGRRGIQFHPCDRLAYLTVSLTSKNNKFKISDLKRASAFRSEMKKIRKIMRQRKEKT